MMRVIVTLCVSAVAMVGCKSTTEINNSGPANSSTGTGYLYAGTSNGIYRSADLGMHWEHVTGTLSNVSVYSFASQPPYLFAGTGSGVMRSKDGISWTNSSLGIAQSEVASMDVYGHNLLAGTLFGIFISSDLGEHWDRAPSQDEGETYTFLNDDSLIFAGDASWGILRSSDSGMTWLRWDSYPLAIDASAATRSNIFTGNPRDGIWRDNHDGFNWAKAPNTGLFDLQVRALTSPDSIRLFAGTASGVFLSNDDATSWTNVYNGSSVCSLASHGSILFAGLADGTVMHSTDNGVTWVSAALPSKDTVYSIYFH